MSIWTKEFMTPPANCGDDSNVNKNPSINPHTNLSQIRRPTVVATVKPTVIEYDFDQIQTLPYDENHMVEPTLHAFHKISASKKIKENAFSFLKNVGSYFPRNSVQIKPSQHPTAATTTNDVQENSFKPIKEILKISNSDNSSISDSSSKELCKKDNDLECDKVVTCDNVDQKNILRATATNATTAPPASSRKLLSSFVLPRVILKNGTNSAVCNNDNSGFLEPSSPPSCYDKGGRERAVSSSHYSTEKSGSSGYYSSNIYSTSSYDEHIYSEPAVVDVLHPAARVNKMCCVVESGNSNNINKLPLNIGEQQQGLINLEKSIKNLEIHLQSFHRPIESFEQCSDEEDENDDAVENPGPSEIYDKRRNDRLPTIMEGIDGQTSSRNNFQGDLDDSLIDLDLDSFLLANEVKGKDLRQINCKKGIDNPSFVAETSTNILTPDKFIENNYKCHKYVNSCPDDPYNVEDVIEDLQPTIDKSLAFYLKKCEDQVHYQNTKDILVEIREKLNSLLSNNDIKNSTNTSFYLKANLQPQITTKEQTTRRSSLQENIISLKDDLDNYLNLMNKNNEMEIKQFCTGLSNNHKLLTIQHALENKARSSRGGSMLDGEDNGYDIFHVQNHVDDNGLTSYKELETPSQFDTVYVRDGFSFGYKNKNLFRGGGKYEIRGNHNCDPNFMLQTKLQNSISSTSTSSSSQSYNNRHDNFSDTITDQSSNNNNNNNKNSNYLNSNKNSDRNDTVINNKNTKQNMSQMKQNLGLSNGVSSFRHNNKNDSEEDKDEMLAEWHKNKPSIWELYYGTNRINQTLFKKVIGGTKDSNSTMSYPSSRPESDFTLDMPRAEQLRIKMKKEKQFRHRCRIITSFLSFIFFLLTVVVVSLILTRGKRMFGSMI